MNIYFDRRSFSLNKNYFCSRKSKYHSVWSQLIRKWKLMHQGFPKHLHQKSLTMLYKYL